MNILQISKYYHPRRGGIETFVRDLVTNPFYEVDVNVVYYSDKNETHRNLLGFKVDFNIGKQPVSLSKIFWLMQNMNKYDIIHFHYPNPLIAIILLFLRKPLVVHWHSDIIVGGILYYFYAPFDYLLRHKAKVIIGTSPTYVDFSPSLRSFRSKISIVPIGLDLTRLDEIGDSSDLLKTPGIIYLLSVGRLTQYKGFSFLISAMLELPNNYVLDIVGSGDLYKDLKGIVKKNGLQDRVSLHEDISDTTLSSYYKRCDLFILPSVTRNEAFGLVQLEAFFYSKPVISTSIEGSGVSWVNRDKETGLVIEPGCVNCLVKAILEAISDGDLGKNNNSYLRSVFDMDVISQRILQIYREI